MINKSVRIQLIDTNKGYLDVKEDTNFPVSYAISEVRDLTERKGTFSKSITLAASENNNTLLNNYFDVNIVAGTFNVNRLQKCIVLEDNVPIVENAVMQLVGIKKVQNTLAYDELVEYTVLVKEATVDFFTKLGSSKLTDLSFPTYKHTYSAANVVSSFAHTYINGYKYVLPQSISDNSYNLQEFQPGIYALNYWNNIFKSKGFTYDWSELFNDDVRFDKLIIPYNGDPADLTQGQIDAFRVEATKSSVIMTSTATPGDSTNSTFVHPITTWTEVTDPAGAFNPTTGVYSNQISSNGGNGLSFNIEFDWELQWVNNSGGTAYLVEDGAGTLNNASIRVLSKFGLTTGNNFPTTYGNAYLTPPNGYIKGEGSSLPNGISYVKQANNTDAVGSVNQSLGYTGAPAIGQQFKFSMQSYCVVQGPTSHWRTANNSSAPLADVQLRTSIRNVRLVVTPTINSVAFGFPIDVNKYIPKEIQQADFIKSIVQLYNLFIDIDPNEPNKLIIKSRDKYYDTGKTVDWTKKLYKNKEQTINWLAASQKKRFILSYKQDTDEPNKGYFNSSNEVYGQQDFTFDNEYIKDIDKKEIIFSPTPVTLSQFGAVTPAINGALPKTNIRILYDGGMYTCSPWNIYDYGQTGQTGLTTYPLFSHFNKPINPTFDINFGVCDYYFYTTFGNKTNNNMYNYHWRRTLNQLNKGHMLIAYFDLNAYDIQKMELNDKIRIDNAYYNINQIVDYNPTMVGPTKVELISVDNELEFTPFKTKPVIAVGSSDTIFKPIKDVERVRWVGNNIISGFADVAGNNNTVGSNVLGGLVVGNGNYAVGGTKADITGDRNVVNANALIIGDDNTSLSKSLIIGDNNNIGEGLDNVLVVGSNITPTTGGIWSDSINGIPTSSIISGLPGVLSIDPTTGANPIVLNAGGSSPITSSSGNSNITMDSGIVNTMLLSQIAGSTSSNILFRPGSPAIGVRMQTINGSDSSNLAVRSTNVIATSTNGTDTSQNILTATTYTINTATTIIQQIPVTDNTNTKVLARNASTGNIEEVDASSIVGVTPDLENVLIAGNITNGNNIILTDGDLLQNTAGTAYMFFTDFGTPGNPGIGIGGFGTNTTHTIIIDPDNSVFTGIKTASTLNSDYGEIRVASKDVYSNVSKDNGSFGAIDLNGNSTDVAINMSVNDTNNFNNAQIIMNPGNGIENIITSFGFNDGVDDKISLVEVNANAVVSSFTDNISGNNSIIGIGDSLIAIGANTTTTNKSASFTPTDITFAGEIGNILILSNDNINIPYVPTTNNAQTKLVVRNSTTGNIELRDVSSLPTVLSARLTAWDAYNSNGIVVQTSSTTWVNRTIIAPAAGITLTNGNGISGNPTLVLANDLAALEALAGTGFAVRTATDTWAQRTITGTAGQITVTNGNGVSGNPTLALDTAALYDSVASISANTTLSSNVTLVDTTSTTITVTLPTAVGNTGRNFTIKDKVGNAGVRNITINTTTSQTIDGLLFQLITNAYESITVISDGSNWFIK